MDARSRLYASALLAVMVVACPTVVANEYATTNFIVHAPDGRFAQQVGRAAEVYRRELAIRWLGEELAPWHEKCPITVQIGPQACGQTSFGFAVGAARSRPTGWKMEVCGSPERILDSVLPHEITHTIFATHFGRPLPRWADEGACTTVEHESERSKNHQLLFQFFNERRTIPFNRMYTIKQYPSDIYPIYAQGYSVARYLIMQGGHRRFVDYIDEGLSRETKGQETQAWDAATKKFYGLENLSELQVSWVQWIKKGCPDLTEPENTSAVAVAEVNAANARELDPMLGAPADQVVQANTGDAALNWYRSQAARVASEQSGDARTGEQVADPQYRPGSTGASDSVQELISGEAQIRPDSRLAGSAGVFYGQSEIIDRKPPTGTVWR